MDIHMVENVGNRMANDYAMNQAMRGMRSYFQNREKIDVLGSIILSLWLFAGLFSDGYLLLISIFISLAVLILVVIKTIFTEEFYYDIHAAVFRRLVIGAIAHWGYTGGRSQGSRILDLDIFEVYT